MAAFTPTRPRSSLLSRTRRRLRRAIPAAVWLLAATAVVALGRQMPFAAELTGIVDAAQGRVTAPVDGRVASLLVALHQEVEAGQVVARLDDGEVKLLLTQASYELERLRADLTREEADRLQQTRAAATEHGLDSVVEHRRLTSDVESAQLDALSVRTQLEETRVRVQGAAVEAERLGKLVGQGMVGEPELVRLATERDALQKRITELQDLYDKHRARVETANQRLREFAPGTVMALPVDAALAPLRWALKVQEANLEHIVLQAGRLDLRAPIRGRIAHLAVEPGEWVSAGDALVSVVDPAPRRILAYVPDAMRSQLGVNHAVHVHRADATLLGSTSIRSISPSVVLVPERLWRDPRIEEWAYEVVVAATGLELPGERVQLALAR